MSNGEVQFGLPSRFMNLRLMSYGIGPPAPIDDRLGAVLLDDAA